MSSRHIVIRPQAERDVDQTTAYLIEEADDETGVRFFDASYKTFQTLLDMPDKGKIRDLKSSRLSSIRQWPISGFEKYLIFYRNHSAGIEIIRVLHGARDIDTILNDEPLSN